MLLTKEVEVEITPLTIKYYEERGYEIPKYLNKRKKMVCKKGTKIKVKVEDLSDGSNKRVDVQCDCEDCKKIINIQWIKYKKYIHSDGKYYCNKCAINLFGKEKSRKTKLLKGKSFYDWCIENNRQDVLDRWDYELNDKKPNEINYGTIKKYFFKCPKGIHESELKSINNIHKNTIILCNQCNSLGQWFININRLDLIKRWSDKNNCDIFSIPYNTTKKYYFKCPRDLHTDELKNINNFIKGHTKSLDCKVCNSFAQWGYDNIDDKFLEKYWDYSKNIDKNGKPINPWEVNHGSPKTKVWIFCQEHKYHGSYKIGCNSFSSQESRCPYCCNRNDKVHSLDSLGQYIVDNYGQDFLNKIWSEKNKKTAFEYTPMSDKEVWWKCLDSKHEDFKRGIGASNICEFRCSSCRYSKGEKRIEEWLNISNFIKITDEEYKNLSIEERQNNKYYIPQKEFDGLLGLGNGNLSYDFYLPQHNLLIEYQGEYHDGTVENQTEEEFKYQQEHDRRKKEYADKNNIKLLPIWYWNFDNIERILDIELNITKSVVINNGFSKTNNTTY